MRSFPGAWFQTSFGSLAYHVSGSIFDQTYRRQRPRDRLQASLATSG